MLNEILNIYKNYSIIINLLAIVFIAIIIILWLKYKNRILDLCFKYKEIVNYIIVGILTTLISISSYYIFRFIISNVSILSLISWIFAVSFAYFSNRKYVFENKSDNILKEAYKFTTSRLTTLLIEIALMNIFTVLIGINDMVSKVIVQFVILVLNYVFSKLFVFNNN